jgi:hypothetical protein
MQYTRILTLLSEGCKGLSQAPVDRVQLLLSCRTDVWGRTVGWLRQLTTSDRGLACTGMYMRAMLCDSMLQHFAFSSWLVDGLACLYFHS